MEDNIQVEVPSDDQITTEVGTEANFDGILDGITGGIPSGGGIIGIVMLLIIGALAYFKFGKKTKVLKKQQKVAVQEYKESKKEAVVEMKQIDKETEDLLQKLIEEENKKDEINEEITNVVLETVDKIEKTKLENKRTVADANTRLKETLSRVRNRRG